MLFVIKEQIKWRNRASGMEIAGLISVEHAAMIPSLSVVTATSSSEGE